MNIATLEGAIERCVRDCRSSRFPREVEIEVAGDYQKCVCTVLMRVVQDLRELTRTECIIAAAFEMDIVGNQVFPKASNMAYKCHSGAEPPLKLGNCGNVPARAPKTRLPSKSKNARFGNRESRERGLAMVGR